MPDSANRKVVCVQYETGKTKTIKKNGKDVSVPETKLLTVGSAFVREEDKEGNPQWVIQGKFHAVPPNWDGRFVLLDPLPKNGDNADDEVPY
jgi:hypothetical protein